MIVSITIAVKQDNGTLITTEGLEVKVRKEILPSLPWAQMLQELLHWLAQQSQAS